MKGVSFFSLSKPYTQVLRSQQNSYQICSNERFINSKRQDIVMAMNGAVFTQNEQKAVKIFII